jgi:hypothetical protein
MTNLLCELPNHCVGVRVVAPHPCGGYYELDAHCYGPRGLIGRWLHWIDLQPAEPHIPPPPPYEGETS